MFFLHTKNLAEFHRWFAWHPVRVLRRTPAGPQFYVVWLSTVRRKLVVSQGVVSWMYEFVDLELPELRPARARECKKAHSHFNATFDVYDRTYEHFIEHMSEQGADIEELTFEQLKTLPPTTSSTILFVSADLLTMLGVSFKPGCGFWFDWNGYRVFTEPSAENLAIKFSPQTVKLVCKSQNRN